MGLEEFFTNKEKTKDGEVSVDAPAFSATKVVATLGVIITAVLGAVPASLAADETVVIVAIGAGTLLLLGVFALIGVDIRTRQKAKAATLRYGDGKAAEAKFAALPSRDLILQLEHSGPEYEVKYATVEKDVIHVFADRDGTPVSVAFKEAPKPK